MFIVDNNQRCKMVFAYEISLFCDCSWLTDTVKILRRKIKYAKKFLLVTRNSV